MKKRLLNTTKGLVNLQRRYPLTEVVKLLAHLHRVFSEAIDPRVRQVVTLMTGDARTNQGLNPGVGGGCIVRTRVADKRTKGSTGLVPLSDTGCCHVSAVKRRLRRSWGRGGSLLELGFVVECHTYRCGGLYGKR